LQTAYTQAPGLSKIGQRLIDPRITVSTDPLDPECGYIPFDNRAEPYQATKWFTNGVLTNLAYDSNYALTQLGQSAPRLNSYAYRMSGGPTSIAAMIASTARGVLVTRFSDIDVVDGVSLLCDGLTRDGLWYIENGAIKYPIKNFRFTESPLVAFNNVVALGAPQRVFGRYPAVVPPVTVRDFRFTSLVDIV
jgi:predicted Zn-dependent protease